MGISRYLAMTASEIETFSPPGDWSAAYMACHFSPYGTGLSNIPATLPSGSMLILTDRTPICGHDPSRIVEQLLEAYDALRFTCILLDLQRPAQPLQALCRALAEAMPCPVGVSDLYARDLSCPVFLPPPPLDQALEEYLAPWKSRELWLDVAPDSELITVTESGSTITHPEFTPQEQFFEDQMLQCRYYTKIGTDYAKFYLWRSLPMLDSFIQKAADLGVTKCIGLYQQLYSF